METAGLIQELITGAVFLVVGLRLYRLSRCTDRLPERLLGLGFVVWSGNYFLYDIPYLLLDASQAAPFYFAARLCLDLGTFLIALFTWKVFRSRGRWGGWLVAGIAACLLVGIGGSVWEGDWEGVLLLSNPWFWPGWLGSTLPLAWMAAEGGHHYRLSLERQRLGLCDAVTCDRFLLWSIVGAIWLLQQFLIIYQYARYEVTQDWNGLIDVAVGSFEILPVALVWLVFYPPAFYRNWIERRYASA